jgi:predicted transcriptional regulator
MDPTGRGAATTHRYPSWVDAAPPRSEARRTELTDISPTTATATQILRMASDIVAAFVSHNTVPPAQLPELIRSVHAALSGTEAPPAAAAAGLVPAVPVKKSVFGDYIVCLEDGKRLKMLKRHLRTAYGMTPDQYRARWNLAPDYPMVAPNYAAQRSDFAKKIGLGHKPGARRGRPPKKT